MIVVPVLLAAVLAAAPPEAEMTLGANARGGHFVFQGDAWFRSPTEVTSAPAASTPYESKRISREFCGALAPGAEASALPCADDAESGSALRQCADGSQELGPLVRRLLDESGAPVGAWEQVDNGGCPEDPDPGVVLSVSEFRRLPLVAAEPVIEPFDGRALIHKGIAVHTAGDVQELSTSVVGVPVQVRATPVQYVWDFGDGTVLTTTNAGHGWPDHAALGPYPEPGEFELRLTTTWRGEFQVNGAGPWLPVSGTATTASAPVPITVVTAPALLYADR